MRARPVQHRGEHNTDTGTPSLTRLRSTHREGADPGTDRTSVPTQTEKQERWDGGGPHLHLLCTHVHVGWHLQPLFSGFSGVEWNDVTKAFGTVSAWSAFRGMMKILRWSFSGDSTILALGSVASRHPPWSTFKPMLFQLLEALSKELCLPN